METETDRRKLKTATDEQCALDGRPEGSDGSQRLGFENKANFRVLRAREFPPPVFRERRNSSKVLTSYLVCLRSVNNLWFCDKLNQESAESGAR